MRLLLDTHVFLWAATAPKKMAASAFDAIVHLENEVYVSAVAAWEIAIKHSLGKLQLPMAPASWLAGRIRQLGFSELAVSVEHAVAIGQLPMHHADPFDRLLIAQAQVEGLTLVTADPQILRYRVKALDARA